MSNLYVFGIGGTGARVIRSLTMLLASGVDCDMNIVPIFIDPDQSANSLTKAIETIDRYVAIHRRLSINTNNENKFFKTEIVDNIIDRYVVQLQNTNDRRFKDYISVDSMDKKNQALIRMLFSNDNLNSGMEVGFEGNPNMGSIVLNQLKRTEGFTQFVTNFREGDKIFIISSIFGGTGASGFPLLLKILRSGAEDMANSNILKQSTIGAISVLPYFSVAPKDDSPIDGSTFVSKTRAALSYYHRNIIENKNNAIDYLYYIADNKGNNVYENNKGGNAQRNKAHLIELLSALAVIDFAKNGNPPNNGQRNTVIKEYGLVNQQNLKYGPREVTFDELGNRTKNQIKNPLIQFLLMNKYLKKYVKDGIVSDGLVWNKNYKFGERNFFKSDFYNDVVTMLDWYIEWLQELSDNSRSFSPFELDATGDNIFSIVKGISPRKSGIFGLGKDNYELFTSKLNAYDRKDQNNELESLFMELFYNTTNNLIEEKGL